MSSLLNRSISDVAQQARGGRASPYSRTPSASGPATQDKWGHDGFEELSKSDRRSSVPTQKLIVEGLHWEVSEDELRDLFEAMGPVRRCFIKYDRSGRSTGVAIVHYENVADASRARSEYDGANAKGQPIKIFFEELRAPRGSGTSRGGATMGRGGATATRGDAASKSTSLQSRFDLLSRMGGERPQPPSNAPKGPSASAFNTNPRGGASSSASRGGGARGGRSVQGGGRVVGGRDGKTIVAGASGREKRLPKSAIDLDAELDAFMQAPPPANGSAEAEATKTAEDADIEMK